MFASAEGQRPVGRSGGVSDPYSAGNADSYARNLPPAWLPMRPQLSHIPPRPRTFDETVLAEVSVHEASQTARCQSAQAGWRFRFVYFTRPRGKEQNVTSTRGRPGPRRCLDARCGRNGGVGMVVCHRQSGCSCKPSARLGRPASTPNRCLHRCPAGHVHKSALRLCAVAMDRSAHVCGEQEPTKLASPTRCNEGTACHRKRPHGSVARWMPWDSTTLDADGCRKGSFRRENRSGGERTTGHRDDAMRTCSTRRVLRSLAAASSGPGNCRAVRRRAHSRARHSSHGVHRKHIATALTSRRMSCLLLRTRNRTQPL